LLLAALTTVQAQATQFIPGGVEYSNDTIEQAGQLQACIITVAIVSPPAAEIVNFQFLNVHGRTGFKVTAADVNWSNQSASAKRISGASFQSENFNHAAAFTQSVSPEGQLVAFLTVPELADNFQAAFFGGRYSIQFRHRYG
jgi:hypothetical protein